MTIPRAGKTLMIVEDEVLIATTLKSELEDVGYNVLNLTGEAAWETAV